MGEQYIDNLKFPQLERNNIKDALVQKEIISVQQKESTLYKEVLKNLTPAQIAGLLEKNYQKNGKFLSYNDIPKDYAYYFLTQTALAMLGYDCSIDGYDGSNFKSAVHQFEIDHNLKVDTGFAGPQVLNALTVGLQRAGFPVNTPSEVIRLPTPSVVATEHASNSIELPNLQHALPSPEEYNQLSKEKNIVRRRQACLVYLQQELGFTPIIAAGIVGNIYAESKFSTTARGDRGRSHGLCQWQGQRRKALQLFALEHRKNVDNYQIQLSFIKHELINTEKNAGRALASATTVQQATEIFLRKYERASIPHTEERIEAATIAYQTKSRQYSSFAAPNSDVA